MIKYFLFLPYQLAIELLYFAMVLDLYDQLIEWCTSYEGLFLLRFLKFLKNTATFWTKILNENSTDHGFESHRPVEPNG